MSPIIDNGDGVALTLPEVLRRHAADRPDAVLLACDGTQLTYGEADARSRALAGKLLAARLRKGAHVALLQPNGPDFIVSALAASRIGAVILPLSTLSTAEELRWLLSHSDANCLIAAPGFRSRNFADLLRAAFADLDLALTSDLSLSEAPNLRQIWFTDALGDPGTPVNDALLDAAEARVLPSDRLAIIHTSGSTSTPKGVIHTHGALLRHLYNINEIRCFEPPEALFSSSPWFWVAGFSFALLGTLVAGARLVCSNATDPSEILDQIEREKPTLTNGYAMTVAKLAEDPSFAARDLSSIRRGNLWPIMPKDVRAPDPGLRHNIYGMTETGGVVTMSSDESDLAEQYRGSCGSVVPGIETRIVDPDTGQECTPGTPGELWLRSPFLMEGYYGRSRSEVFEPDGWWRTGDIGSFDSAGFFYISGRRGEMIKTSGANVAPREVEAVLQDVSGGCQSFVLGLPDDQRGQVVVGVVVAEPDSPFDEADLQRRAAERLSSYKVPRRIFRFARDEIPVLSSGKVNARELADAVRQQIKTSRNG